MKIDNWSVMRRMESLRQMDQMLDELGCASRYVEWKQYGFPCATKEETDEKLRKVAESDELYSDALFTYMICTLEKRTLSGFGTMHNVKL